MSDYKTTIRMRFKGDPQNTLNGYVFSDMAHAHRWIAQAFVDRSDMILEEVRVKKRPRRICDCGKYSETVEVIRRRHRRGGIECLTLPRTKPH